MRRSRIAAIVLVAVLVTGKFGVTQPPDAAELQGAWEIVSVERSGVPDPTPVGHTMTFQGDVVKFQAPGMSLDGSLTVPWTAAVVDKAEPIDPAKERAMMRY